MPQAKEEAAADLAREFELQRTELTRVGYVASKAAVREAAALKEEGTVPFSQHKDEVRLYFSFPDAVRTRTKLKLMERIASTWHQCGSKIECFAQQAARSDEIV